jgi:hypothetical protein
MAKTFKCPYCDYHGSRQDLVEHIDDEHDEMIPEGFSPVHLVFDIVNGKKDHHGVCVVCKRDTEWDENASKYKRLCGRKQCAEALRDIYKKNMLKVHGKITLLNDPEQQKKMLANRGISGKVQFDDKGFHTYTGSYERKLLKFENSIGFKSSDILSPGPTIEYDYKGEKHKYITDQMIIPFNLISTANWNLNHNINNIKQIENSINNPLKNVRVIDQSLNPIEVSIKIANAISNKECVAFMADRAVDPRFTQKVEFLGELASFNTNPFKVAYKTKTPLTLFFIVHKDLQNYYVHSKEIKMDFSLDENSAVTNSLNEYVKDFEAIVKKYPNQWFNLYNFWER